MQKLPVRQRLLLGFTLFSMFFGAGNLIFPPHLGAQAGSNFWPAFAGFAVGGSSGRWRSSSSASCRWS